MNHRIMNHRISNHRIAGSQNRLIRIGSLKVRVESDHGNFLDPFQQLYGHHPALPPDTLCDLYTEIRSPTPWRRWLRPQLQFYRDGQVYFRPVHAAQAAGLWEWGLNYCIASECQHWLLVHGAVLARGEQAVIMPAVSGSGKSTLTAALCHSGWRLLSDEFVALDPATGLIHPLPRPVSLKNDAIDLIAGLYPQARIPAIIHGTMKGTIGLMSPPPESAQDQQLVKPALILSPTWQRAGGFKLQRQSEGQALLMLANNAMNYPLWGADGFNFLADLAQEIPAFTLSYHRLDEAIDWLGEKMDACFAIAAAV